MEETCPYCSATVAEELIRFGGACPTCFNTIPGEEAPTDPGIQEQPKEEEQKKSAAGPIVLVAILLLAVGAFFAMSGGEEVVEEVSTEADDQRLAAEVARAEADAAMAQQARDEAEAAEEAERLAAEAAALAAASARASAQQAAAQVAAEEAAIAEYEELAAQPYEDRVPEIAVESLSVGSVSQGSVGSSTLREPTIGVNPTRDAGPVVLTSSREIQRAVRRVLSQNRGQLEFCYEQQMDPGLRGTWRVGFTVMENGTTGEITVQGLNRSHSGIESCIEGSVSRWSFPHIADATHYEKEYTFGT